MPPYVQRLRHWIFALYHWLTKRTNVLESAPLLKAQPLSEVYYNHDNFEEEATLTMTIFEDCYFNDGNAEGCYFNVDNFEDSYFTDDQGAEALKTLLLMIRW